MSAQPLDELPLRAADVEAMGEVEDRDSHPGKV
jgi:hypothetical protein